MEKTQDTKLEWKWNEVKYPAIKERGCYINWKASIKGYLQVMKRSIFYIKLVFSKPKVASSLERHRLEKNKTNLIKGLNPELSKSIKQCLNGQRIWHFKEDKWVPIRTWNYAHYYKSLEKYKKQNVTLKLNNTKFWLGCRVTGTCIIGQIRKCKVTLENSLAVS